MVPRTCPSSLGTDRHRRSNPGVLERVNHWNWSSIGSRNSISKTKSTDKNLRRNVKWGMWEKQAPHLHELTDWLQVQFSPSILWAPFTQRWAFTTANASNVEFFTTVIYKNIYYKCWGFIKLSNVIGSTKHNIHIVQVLLDCGMYVTRVCAPVGEMQWMLSDKCIGGKTVITSYTLELYNLAYLKQ